MYGVVLAGPTGVGKTDLSLKLAKGIGAEILSADSMQIYKKLDIGTAKIMPDEMSGITHHLLDIVEPDEDFSVGDYQIKGDEILNKLYEEKKNVLITGGTGLYINSLTEGLANLPSEDKEIRNSLMHKSKEELYDTLQKYDKESAELIHINNKKRVIRALEVILLTGEKFSELRSKNIKNNPYKFYKFALERDRDYLYERINQRVEIMIEKGLIDEAYEIYQSYQDSLVKIQAIGYKELFLYFAGKSSLDNAIELIKRESRRYAKRQFTWFKNDPTYIWYNLDQMSENEIIDDILAKISKDKNSLLR